MLRRPALGRGAARRLDPELGGDDRVGADLLPVDLDDPRGGARRHLVESVLPGYHQRPVDAETRQCTGDRLEVARIRDSDQLPARAGRVGQRPEEVEDRPHGQLAANSGHETGRLVMRGSEHEAEARFVDAPSDGGGVEVDPRSQRLQQVGGARRAPRRAVAVLGDRAAGAGGDQRRRRRHVEAAPAATRPRRVQKVRGERVDVDRQLAHRARQPGELVDRLALGAQGDQKAGDLRRRHRAAHDLGQYRRSLGGAQVAPAGDRVERIGDQLVGLLTHAASPPRKLASRAIPSSVSTDSGWNWTPSAGSSRWRMPISTPSPRALTSRQSGRSSATISEW